jgi:hypothetical protein
MRDLFFFHTPHPHINTPNVVYDDCEKGRAQSIALSTHRPLLLSPPLFKVKESGEKDKRRGRREGQRRGTQRQKEVKRRWEERKTKLRVKNEVCSEHEFFEKIHLYNFPQRVSPIGPHERACV